MADNALSVVLTPQFVVNVVQSMDSNAGFSVLADTNKFVVTAVVGGNFEGNVYTDEDKNKLAAIEALATVDQTGAEIKTLYEAEADTNAFDDVAVAKLAAIEAGATADLTGAEIKALYEAEANTNEFDDAEQTKLAGIATAATIDQTGAAIKTLYEAENDTNAFNDAAVSKLAAIEASATADQSNAEIETAYNAQVSKITTPEIAAATEAAVRRFSPVDVKAMVLAHETGGGGGSDWEINNQTGTSYTLVVADVQRLVRLANASAIALTVPTNAAQAIPIGSQIRIAEYGVGTVTIDGAGVTLNTGDNLILGTQHEGALLIKVATNEWDIIKDLGGGGSMSDAEVKTAYENNANTNEFDDAEQSKLAGIESNATVDQTNAEIRAAVAAATDSNVFDDADVTKLGAIEASATADQTDAEIRTAIEAATDSNAFTDADHSKLDAIEASATADQSNAEIATAYAVINDQVSAGEITAGTEGTLRTYAPDDIVSFIDQHAAAGGDPVLVQTPTRSVVTLSGATTTLAIPDGVTWFKVISDLVTMSNTSASCFVGLRWGGTPTDQDWSGFEESLSTALVMTQKTAADGFLITSSDGGGTARSFEATIWAPRDDTKKTVAIGVGIAHGTPKKFKRNVIADLAKDDDTIFFAAATGTMTGTVFVEWFYDGGPQAPVETHRPTRSVVTISGATTVVAIPDGVTWFKLMTDDLAMSTSAASPHMTLSWGGTPTVQLWDGIEKLVNTAFVAAVLTGVTAFAAAGAEGGTTVRSMDAMIFSPRDATKKTIAIGNGVAHGNPTMRERRVTTQLIRDDDTLTFIAGTGTMTGTAHIEWFYDSGLQAPVEIKSPTRSTIDLSVSRESSITVPAGVTWFRYTTTLMTMAGTTGAPFAGMKSGADVTQLWTGVENLLSAALVVSNQSANQAMAAAANDGGGLLRSLSGTVWAPRDSTRKTLSLGMGISHGTPSERTRKFRADTAVDNDVFFITGNTTDVTTGTCDIEWFYDGGPVRAGINLQTGTSYTLVLTDSEDILEMNNAAANVVTIPADATLDFAVGTVITVTMLGAGITSITAAAGVDLNGVTAGSGEVSAQYNGVSLYKRAADKWIIQGAIGAIT